MLAKLGSSLIKREESLLMILCKLASHTFTVSATSSEELCWLTRLKKRESSLSNTLLTSTHISTIMLSHQLFILSQKWLLLDTLRKNSRLKVNSFLISDIEYIKGVFPFLANSRAKAISNT